MPPWREYRRRKDQKQANMREGRDPPPRAAYPSVGAKPANFRGLPAPFLALFGSDNATAARMVANSVIGGANGKLALAHASKRRHLHS